MTLKKYLRLEEAAEYLSRKIGFEIGIFDIRDLSNEGVLNPVVYYSGRMAVPESDPIKGDVKSYCFEGYFTAHVVKKNIFGSGTRKPLNGPLSLYESIKDDFPYQGPDTQSLKEDLLLWPVTKAFITIEQVEEHTPYFFPSDIYIPRAELDALIARHQANSTPAPAPVAASEPESEPAPQDTEAKPEDLNAKARTTALQIIAALASYPDLLPLDEPYKSAQVLIAHADGTGQPLPSMETVAQWLKAANPR